MKTRAILAVALFPGILAASLLADTHYVAASSSAPVAPYTNGWSSAATNIQEAVDAAIDGDTVLVANGVYDSGDTTSPVLPYSTRVNVDKAVTVASDGDPDTTVIVGAQNGPLDSTRGVYLANGAVLMDFTVSNGYSQKGRIGGRIGVRHLLLIPLKKPCFQQAHQMCKVGILRCVV